ncbi:MAG: DEAD/DEAH box helicase [Methanobacterium sp.]
MIEDTLKTLESRKWYKNRVEHIETLKPQEAVYGKTKGILPQFINNYLRQNNITLYKHQSEVIDLLRKGENVIITTPTASGKTLSFNIPIFEKLTNNKDATALYIYPAKALANDQLISMKELEKYCGMDLNPAVYDGDTSKEEKRKIRKISRIIVTNPYELHNVLPWHHQWEKFLSNLEYIVIDEAHKYRGVFGSNVAFLIRRFLRICNYYGSNPQFVLSTATLANPEEFSQKLVGAKFNLIKEDGSPKGKKHFIFYNPYYDGVGKTTIHVESQNLFQLFLLNNLQTLCFTTSRKMAELIARRSQKEIVEIDQKLAQRISAYRAGYLAKDRRKIENGLKSGSLRGVTATNALELGIDIGSLDSVIISGYPGTLMSTWQQAGRAGRGTDDSIVTFVGFQNPLDQYFMKHPQIFFDKPHEHAIIDLSNPNIIRGHLMCAANEMPLNQDLIKIDFEGDVGEHIKVLSDEKQIAKSGSKWAYSGSGYPPFKVNLGNLSSEIFKVYHKGRILETMDKRQAYNEAHQGAVLINKGETYIVHDFNLARNTIKVVKKDVNSHTSVLKDIDIKVLKEINQKTVGGIKISFGELRVSEHYLKYKVMEKSKVVSVRNLKLPPIQFKTKGMWFTLPENLKEGIKCAISGKEVFEGGIHGVEHAMIAIIPFHVMCDRFDIGGVSTPNHEHTKMATIFIYDGYEGGIGLTGKAFDLIEEITRMTHELVRDCTCEEGCPACIYSPKCGNDNKPLNKEGTLFILNQMLDLMEIER